MLRNLRSECSRMYWKRPSLFPRQNKISLLCWLTLCWQWESAVFSLTQRFFRIPPPDRRAHSSKSPLPTLSLILAGGCFHSFCGPLRRLFSRSARREWRECCETSQCGRLLPVHASQLACLAWAASVRALKGRRILRWVKWEPREKRDISANSTSQLSSSFRSLFGSSSRWWGKI